MRNTSTRGVARVGFVLALTILTLMGVLAYRSDRSLVKSEDAIFQSQQVVTTLDEVLAGVLEVESASRGYLIAGRELYIEPYTAASKRMDATLGRLEALLAGKPYQRSSFESLRSAVAAKLAFHGEMVEARRNNIGDAGRDLFLTGRGHALMDDIRSRVDGMKAAESRVLSDRTAAARRGAGWSIVALVGGFALSFAILLAVYYRLTSENRKRRRSEEKLLRLNRIYAVLSRVNQSMAHIREPLLLFREVCRAAVEDGLFRMAWVGTVDPQTGRVEPVVYAGFEDGYLAHIRISAVDSPEGSGPTGTALRERRHYVCSDVEQDPRFSPWREAALQRGYHSVAAFPIQSEESLAGVLTVYAGEPGFFDEEIVALLSEVTGDVSFALQSIDGEERRREAEEALRLQDKALRHSEEKYRRIVETAAEGVWTTDQNNITTFANRKLADMLGTSVDEMSGRSIFEFLPEAQARRIAAGDQGCGGPGGADRFDFRFRRPDGAELWIDLCTTPVFVDGRYSGAVAMLTDITERKCAEDEVLRLNQGLERRVAQRTAELERLARELETRNREVERANRMKTEFLARMSHELRTPLNAIVGYSDLLAEEPAGRLAPTYKRFVANIQEGARHLLSMVNDLLDLSKIEAGRIDLNRQWFPAPAALAEVLSVISPLAGIKNITLENQIPTDMRVNADRTRFKQIVYNLLSNAVKFTPEGGRVRIAESSRGNIAGICVGDTGIGIPSGELGSIFEEFHQVGAASGAATEGAGLGLAITRRLVELHGGEIQVESAPGKGSSFSFSLGPHSLEAPASVRAEDSAPEPAAGFGVSL